VGRVNVVLVWAQAGLLFLAVLLAGCGGDSVVVPPDAAVDEDAGVCFPALPSISTSPCTTNEECATGAPCASGVCEQGSCHAIITPDGTPCIECGSGLCMGGMCQGGTP
jgi:hypothetical protein